MTISTEPAPEQGKHLAMIEPVRSIPGYAYRLDQPALTLCLHVPNVALELGERAGPARREISQALEVDTMFPAPRAGLETLHQTLSWAVALQVKAGLPVFQQALASPFPNEVYAVVLPCLTHASGILAMQGAVELMNGAFKTDLRLQERPHEHEQMAKKHLELVAALIAELAKSAPKGFNTIHFLRAAHDMGAPWTQLSEGIFQIGWGSCSRLLMSSFTDATPAVSAMLARDKLLAAATLRAAGLPVPAHAPAQNEEQALKIAQQLGYPVVVKPGNLDGGVGVAAWLTSPDAVRAAYIAAREYSEHVLVEKHVEGRDYRLHIVNDEVQGILERVPGGVTGDGVHSVMDLMDQQNFARKVATDDRKYLKAIQHDDEARRMLLAFGMDASFVPAPGQLVRLRAAANVATGGVPVALNLADAHPDNLQLALRAARILRLDLAGVDLLIADIAQSWLKTGAAICEVNAQPQMFTTMHKPTLQRLLGRRNGRIPAVVVIGETLAGQVAKAVHEGLDSSGCIAGLVQHDGVWMSGHCMARGPMGLLHGGRMLLCDRKIDAVVLASVSHQAIPEGGWPVDRCDVVILAGAAAESLSDKKVVAAWMEAVRMLRPRCAVVSAVVMQALNQFGLAFPSALNVRLASGESVADLASVALEALSGQEACVE